jgi:hypothetical protein
MAICTCTETWYASVARFRSLDEGCWCADVKGTFNAQSIAVAIETKYLAAIAEAWAYSFQSNPPGICIAAASAKSTVTPV